MSVLFDVIRFSLRGRRSTTVRCRMMRMADLGDPLDPDRKVTIWLSCGHKVHGSIYEPLEVGSRTKFVCDDCTVAREAYESTLPRLGEYPGWIRRRLFGYGPMLNLSCMRCGHPLSVYDENTGELEIICDDNVPGACGDDPRLHGDHSKLFAQVCIAAGYREVSPDWWDPVLPDVEGRRASS